MKLAALESISRFFEQAGNDLHLLKHDYFVIGSAAMVLAGCEMDKVGDINLLTSSSDANFLKDKWKDREVADDLREYKRTFRSNSGRFHFEGLDAEVMGNLEVNAGQQWVPLLVLHFMNVTVAGMQVKIPTPREQHRIYRFFGLPKDIQKADLLLKYF